MGLSVWSVQSRVIDNDVREMLKLGEGWHRGRSLAEGYKDIKQVYSAGLWWPRELLTEKVWGKLEPWVRGKEFLVMAKADQKGKIFSSLVAHAFVVHYDFLLLFSFFLGKGRKIYGDRTGNSVDIMATSCRESPTICVNRYDSISIYPSCVCDAFLLSFLTV